MFKMPSIVGALIVAVVTLERNWSQVLVAVLFFF